MSVTRPLPEVDIYRSLPLETLEALDRYLEAGVWPGHTLGAVLRNDLVAVMRHGDEAFRRDLRLLVLYLDNRVPAAAWGTEERVAWWGSISDRETREAYLRQHGAHREYIRTRRQQQRDFVESCRDNDAEWFDGQDG
jgi:hypothetical protein